MDISNYNAYIEGMKKSLRDKMFFKNHIKEDNVDYFIDFGCANGEMLAQIHEEYPNWRLMGIDNNTKMLQVASQKCPEASFWKGLEYVNPGDSALLNLSSVIHEIYSYCANAEIKAFWGEVLHSRKWKYISIRDFMVAENTDRPSIEADRNLIIQNANLDQVNSFISRWGDITNQRTMMHYLLKYRYTANWEREVDENYFPITLEKLLGLIPEDEYEIVYFEHYALPFTQNKIKEDFGIELQDPTHVKLLLRRKD